MLQSIIVYTTLSLILFLLGWHINQRELRLKLHNPEAELSFWNWEIVASIVIVTLVMGLRFKTGSDYEMYLKQFNSVRETGQFVRGDFEIGFYWITRLFADSGLHYAFYFGFWALVQIGSLYVGLRHHKHLLPWVGMILILGPYGINWISFMRQWTISMILVAIVPLIEKRKFWLYLIVVLLSMTIHRSAWLLLLFYFIPYIKFKTDSTKLPLIIFSLCVLLGIWPIWFKLFRFVPDLLDLIGYHKYGHHLVDVMDGKFKNMGWGPLHIITIISSLIFIIFYPQVKKYFSKDKLLPIFYAFAFVGTCYDNLVLNTHHSMQRPAEYLYIFIVIMVSYTISYLTSTKKHILAAICMAIPCLYLILDLIKVSIGMVSYPSLYYHFLF